MRVKANGDALELLSGFIEISQPGRKKYLFLTLQTGYLCPHEQAEPRTGREVRKLEGERWCEAIELPAVSECP